MSFVSLKFILFFSIVISIFYLIPNRWRTLFLLAASYFFYMNWKLEFGLLVLFSTVVIFITALLMENKPLKTKKLLVASSIIINLGLLFLFKYYSFFTETVNNLLSLLSIHYQLADFKAIHHLNFLTELFTPLSSCMNSDCHSLSDSIITHVGISFYSMQAVSYVIDVYRGKIAAEKNFGICALYLSFFPTILAGPIERATNIIPQFHKNNGFDYKLATDGLKLIAWGFFKKAVVADRLSVYINNVFGNPFQYDGWTLFIASFMFSLWIYYDFSSYSDIAIGAGRVLGYRLMDNFNRPFHASSIAELWQRWHISLTSWFRDYVYIPLGGNKVTSYRWSANILLVFFLSGLWHGAQWTFIIWAMANGVFSVIGKFSKSFRTRLNSIIQDKPLAGNAVLLLLFLILVFISRSLASSKSISPVISNLVNILIYASALYLFYNMVLWGLGKIHSENISRLKEYFKKGMNVFLTFNLFTLAVIFFKAQTVAQGWYIVTHMLSFNTANIRAGLSKTNFNYIFLVIAMVEILQLVQIKGSIIERLRSRPLWQRWALYFLLMQVILWFGVFGDKQFSYFRF